VGAVAVVALTVAWFGYPPPFVHRLEALSGGAWLRIAVAAAVLGGVVVVAGRPLGPDRRAGLLWGHPRATNNVRPWIDAAELSNLLGRSPRADKPATHDDSPL
jgi:hypothetical protein